MDTTTATTGTHGDYDESGVDLSLLRWILTLSPLERLQLMDAPCPRYTTTERIWPSQQKSPVCSKSLSTCSALVFIEGVPLNLIGLDDLIAIKQHLGRAKDRAALIQLEALRRLRQRE